MIVIDDVLNFIGTDPFTVEAWICRAPPRPRSPEKHGRILDKLDLSPVGNGYALDLREPAGDLTFQRWQDDEAEIATATLENDGRFHHVAAVVDGSVSRLFVDGEEVGGAAITHGLEDVATNVVIGSSEDDPEAGFRGIIDDVAVYSGIVDVVAHYHLVVMD